MTPEEKQRIEQIRERHLRVDCYKSQMRTDIDFLLSLVKSQEAPPTLMSSEVALKIALHIKGKNSDYFLMREGLAELESIVSKHFANAALSNTAASMRSACVERVKAFATEKWNKQYEAQGQASALLRAEADAANEIAVLLESLSTEKPKE